MEEVGPRRERRPMDAAIEPTGTVFTAFLENPFPSLFTTTA
jgi:hypothetical protein